MGVKRKKLVAGAAASLGDLQPGDRGQLAEGVPVLVTGHLDCGVLCRVGSGQAARSPTILRADTRVTGVMPYPRAAAAADENAEAKEEDYDRLDPLLQRVRNAAAGPLLRGVRRHG